MSVDLAHHEILRAKVGMGGIRLFQVRLWTCRVFITELRIEHSLQSSFVRFLCGLKVDQALCPRLIPGVRLISA